MLVFPLNFGLAATEAGLRLRQGLRVMLIVSRETRCGIRRQNDVYDRRSRRLRV